MKTLYVIDATGILFRAFFALPPMRSPEGLPTNALYGLARALLALEKKFFPESWVAVFDGPNNSASRKAFFPEYKGHREKPPEEMLAQIEPALELVHALKIPYLSLEGVEADDVIASCAKKAVREGEKVVVVSQDKDLVSLVDHNISLYNPVKAEMFTPENAEEHYGIAPRLFLDYLALCGDASDGVPGVKGIGPKTAINLLRQFGSLEGIYAGDFAGVTPRVKNLLLDKKADAFLSKRLVTLDKDLPIPEEGLFYQKEGSYASSLKPLFEKWGFNSLLKDLAKEDAVHEEKKLGQSEFISFLSEKPSVFVFLDPSDAGVNCFTKEGKTFFSWEDLKTRNIFSLDAEFVFVDAKLFFHKADRLEIAFPKKYQDLSLLAYLLEENLPETPEACYTFFTGAMERLEARSVKDLYFNVELPLVYLLFQMEKRGISVDKKILESQEKEVLHLLKQKEGEIFSLLGKEFNLNSPKQLSEVLFEDLGLLPPKGKKKSTSADILEAMEDFHPAIAKILEFRTLEKLRSTYLSGLQNAIASDGKIHCTFLQTQTRTGRLSCRDPNLQNIPLKKPMGRAIRQAFLAEKGSLLLSADYSQIELRLLAEFSGDLRLRQAFLEKRDIHAETARAVFHVPLGEEVSDLLRTRAKAVNYGILYGQSSRGLSEELKISLKEAQAFIDAYFAAFPDIKAYLDHLIESAREKGYAETLLKRKRLIPELTSSRFLLRSLGERLAVNTPLQGSAADLIKEAMLLVDKKIKEKGYNAHLLLQIHDEVILEVSKEEVSLVEKEVKQAMENVWRLHVPLEVSTYVGNNWQEC